MSLRQRYVDLLTRLVPAGVGVTLLLGSAMPGQASDQPLNQQPNATTGARVSERLAAIREAVSAVTPAEASKGVQTAQWWGNYPWGNGWHNWHNWHNWGNGWHNWGNWWRY